ncbi:CGNR zinc finger domain-containing protein [Egicoccus sp. AB-alg2]|uniref:CGNR zinc finger domain-containing protein n=1 Tax=Egicoccus sp. AB-alg2 TaxID=3242693 RepID=UPI00359EEB84
MTTWTDPVPLAWIVAVVNEYGTRAREAAGERERPYPSPETLPEPPALAGRLDVPALREVADRLDPVFAASTAEAAIDHLDGVLVEFAPLTRVQAVGGRPMLAWQAAAGMPAVLSACAITLVQALGEGAGVRRLGTCDAERCGDVYVDTSPTSTRRFCSTTCQTRTKVAAHRRRRRERPTSATTASD